ncbi:MAG: (d)CMP kinase [Bacteroidia bacterium]|nr:(d)CMP kinase [Bacteroidia bacterium]
MKRITIAIDGYAGCGKSSTAKAVARKLNYLYIDSGAMYRAVSLYLLRHNIPFETESDELLDALENIYVDFLEKPGELFPVITLNGQEVEDEIRNPEISAIVSQVSIHREVRREMVSQQRRLGESGGVVMDGRDIGTVVFPNAELKVFMTASPDVRALRRKEELAARGLEVSLEEILENLLKRDKIDSSRKESPLKQANDAILIDTSFMEFKDQVDRVVSLANAVIAGNTIHEI